MSGIRGLCLKVQQHRVHSSTLPTSLQIKPFSQKVGDPRHVCPIGRVCPTLKRYDHILLFEKRSHVRLESLFNLPHFRQNRPMVHDPYIRLRIRLIASEVRLQGGKIPRLHQCAAVDSAVCWAGGGLDFIAEGLKIRFAFPAGVEDTFPVGLI